MKRGTRPWSVWSGPTITRLGFPSAGLHGLRVAGYNGTRSVLGEAIAVAQGGWQSGAHNRYWRCSMASILDIPAAIIGALGDGPPAPVGEATDERPARAPGHRVVRQDLARALDEYLDEFIEEVAAEEPIVRQAAVPLRRVPARSADRRASVRRQPRGSSLPLPPR